MNSNCRIFCGCLLIEPHSANSGQFIHLLNSRARLRIA